MLVVTRVANIGIPVRAEWDRRRRSVAVAFFFRRNGVRIIIGSEAVVVETLKILTSAQLIVVVIRILAKKAVSVVFSVLSLGSITSHLLVPTLVTSS